MDPIFTVLEFASIRRPIGNYGIMLASAILIGTLFSMRATKRAGMDPFDTLAAAGFTVFGAFTGSVVLHAIVQWVTTGSPFTGGPGLVFYGAPIGGGLAAIASCRAFDMPLLKTLDLCVPAIPLAHALGRLGCFFAGCCFGAEHHGALSVTFTHALAPGSYPPVARHPVQLYEAAGLLFIAATFILIRPREVSSGRRLFFYLLAYAPLRFTVELVRGDVDRGVFFGLGTSQWIAIGMALFALVGLSRTRNAGSLSAA